MPVDREPVPLHAPVDRPHLVGGVLNGDPRSERSGREREHAVGVVQRGVLGARLIEVGKTVLAGPRERRAESNASLCGGKIVVVHVARLAGLPVVSERFPPDTAGIHQARVDLARRDVQRI